MFYNRRQVKNIQKIGYYPYSEANTKNKGMLCYIYTDTERCPKHRCRTACVARNHFISTTEIDKKIHLSPRGGAESHTFPPPLKSEVVSEVRAWRSEGTKELAPGAALLV